MGFVHCYHRTHVYLYGSQWHPPMSHDEATIKVLSFNLQENATDICCTDKHLEGSSQFFEVAAFRKQLSNRTRST